MRALDDVDGLLRAEGRYDVRARDVPFVRILAVVLACGFLYGATMGGFAGRPLQMLQSGVKVPLLLLGSSAIVLPSFFVLNTVAGLRESFAAALRAVFAAQAVVALTLASLAPLIVVGYASTATYVSAMRLNFVAFGLATLAGHVASAKFYRHLVLANPRHAWMRRAWTLLYVFVGIQLAWVCRPFVGDPHQPTTFFRADAWSNAYVIVAHRILGL